MRSLAKKEPVTARVMDSKRGAKDLAKIAFEGVAFGKDGFLPTRIEKIDGGFPLHGIALSGIIFGKGCVEGTSGGGCLFVGPCVRGLRFGWVRVAVGGLLMSSFLLKNVLVTYTRGRPIPTVPSSPRVRKGVRGLLGGLALRRGVNRVYRLAVNIVASGDNRGLDRSLLSAIVNGCGMKSVLGVPFNIDRGGRIFTSIVARVRGGSLRRVEVPYVCKLSRVRNTSCARSTAFFPRNVGVTTTFGERLAGQYTRVATCRAHTYYIS